MSLADPRRATDGLLRDLADPRIRLAQLDAEPLGEFHQLLTGPMHQLGVGR